MKFIGLFLFLFFVVSSLVAVPTSSLEYTDYLPRYKRTAQDFIITQINYTKDQIELQIRFIAEQDKVPVHFYGANKPEAFKMQTRQYSLYQDPKASSNIQVSNIRINNQLKVLNLSKDEQVEFLPAQGAIVSFELHLPKMMASENLNIVGGAKSPQGNDRFSFTELFVKKESSKNLGTPEQMFVALDAFYQKAKYIQYPDLKQITSYEQEISRQASPQEAMAAPNLEQLDYMPRLMSIESGGLDLESNERFILEGVSFFQGNIDFEDKAETKKVLTAIALYLKEKPHLKITLHNHTNKSGDASFDLLLSESRVFEIKKILMGKGIDKSRILTIYHGSEHPLPSQNGLVSNSRTEIEIQEDK